MRKRIFNKNNKLKINYFLLLWMVCSIIIPNTIPEVKAYNSDYVYSMDVGDIFVYRISEDSVPTAYKKYTIISKVEGYSNNFSIWASYENYTVSSGITQTENNVSFSPKSSIYMEYKPGGSYDNLGCNKESITIMDQMIECWVLDGQNDYMGWITTGSGLEVKLDYNNGQYTEELISYNDENLQSLAESEKEVGPINIQGSLANAGDIVHGTGTEQDPYVIEDITLNGKCNKNYQYEEYPVGMTIDTGNSEDTSFLVIRHVDIQGYKGGLYVSNVQNLKIEDSIISNTCHTGLNIDAGTVVIDNITMTNCSWYGMYIRADDVSIHNNHVSYTKEIDQGDDTGSGLSILTQHGTIEQNIFEKNNDFGIFVHAECKNLTIHNNQLCNNNRGGIGGNIFDMDPIPEGIWFYDNTCADNFGSDPNKNGDSNENLFEISGYPLYTMNIILLISLCGIIYTVLKKKE